MRTFTTLAIVLYGSALLKGDDLPRVKIPDETEFYHEIHPSKGSEILGLTVTSRQEVLWLEGTDGRTSWNNRVLGKPNWVQAHIIAFDGSTKATLKPWSKNTQSLTVVPGSATTAEGVIGFRYRDQEFPATAGRSLVLSRGTNGWTEGDQFPKQKQALAIQPDDGKIQLGNYSTTIPAGKIKRVYELGLDKNNVVILASLMVTIGDSVVPIEYKFPVNIQSDQSHAALRIALGEKDNPVQIVRSKNMVALSYYTGKKDVQQMVALAISLGKVERHVFSGLLESINQNLTNYDQNQPEFKTTEKLLKQMIVAQAMLAVVGPEFSKKEADTFSLVQFGLGRVSDRLGGVVVRKDVKANGREWSVYANVRKKVASVVPGRLEFVVLTKPAHSRVIARGDNLDFYSLTCTTKTPRANVKDLQAVKKVLASIWGDDSVKGVRLEGGLPASVTAQPISDDENISSLKIKGALLLPDGSLRILATLERRQSPYFRQNTLNGTGLDLRLVWPGSHFAIEEYKDTISVLTQVTSDELTVFDTGSHETFRLSIALSPRVWGHVPVETTELKIPVEYQGQKANVTFKRAQPDEFAELEFILVKGDDGETPIYRFAIDRIWRTKDQRVEDNGDYFIIPE